MRRGRWELMTHDAEPVALFDVEADPLERTNVLAENTKLVGERLPDLKAWLAESRAIGSTPR